MSRTQSAVDVQRLTDAIQSDGQRLFAVAWKTLKLHGIDPTPGDLEDAVSDAYLIAARLIGKQGELITDPASWFRSILYNTCLNEARKRGRRQDRYTELPEDGTELEFSVTDQRIDAGQEELNRLLDTKLLLRKLDTEEARMLAALLAGFTAKEIAETTGARPAAIRQRKRRLIIKLQNLLRQATLNKDAQDD